MSTPPAIIWQIVIISLVMVILSQWFQKRFSTSHEEQMKLQFQMQELQERLKNTGGNPQLIQDINIEMMGILQKTFKKQLIPMCVRSLWFIGILAILGAIYKEYTEIFTINILFFGKGWLALYFVASTVISIIFGLIKMAYRNITGKGKPEEQITDQIRALQRNVLVTRSMGSGYGAGGMVGMPGMSRVPRMADASGMTPYQRLIAESENANNTATNPDKDATIITSTPAPQKLWKQKLIEDESEEQDPQPDDPSKKKPQRNPSWKQKID